jgi:acyl-CoA synthetase (AMP-forming)/AMP-acid ligase II
MKSTMQDEPLSVSRLLSHAARVHPDSEVVTATPDGTRRRTFAEVAERAGRLAGALRACGVDGDQRVATFMWNNSEHLEVYLAAPSMGAVLHTLNIRLFPDQVTYVANHAEDKVVVVDASLLAPFAKLLPTFETVTHVLVAVDSEPAQRMGQLRRHGADLGIRGAAGSVRGPGDRLLVGVQRRAGDEQARDEQRSGLHGALHDGSLSRTRPPREGSAQVMGADVRGISRSPPCSA